ncbi:unnamed protein product [Choristocarpus tenellus]
MVVSTSILEMSGGKKRLHHFLQFVNQGKGKWSGRDMIVTSSASFINIGTLQSDETDDVDAGYFGATIIGGDGGQDSGAVGGAGEGKGVAVWEWEYWMFT